MARILLVDDEDTDRATIRAMLIACGHEVDEAENGRRALDRFHARPPELVMTDLIMPVMDGIELIRALQRGAAAVPIIATCGDGAAPAGSNLRIAKKLGATEVLAKPFSRAELEHALRACLTKRVGPPLTFLVLDDDSTSRFLSRAMLELEFPDCTVLESHSVADALATTDGRRLDAVITDHHLGEADGSEFVSRLRARGASCPVIMVTGSSDPKVHARAYAAGASKVFFGGETDFIGYLQSCVPRS